MKDYIDRLRRHLHDQKQARRAHLDHREKEGEDCPTEPDEDESLIELFLLVLIELVELLRPRLNLTIQGSEIMNIGDTATAKISPTAAGQPSTVSNVVYDVSPPGAYSIVPAADGLSAVYVAAVAGTGNRATVKAINAAGTVLTDSAALPDVSGVVGPPADALNLAVTTP